MALKVKAVERLLKFDKEKAGKYRYVMKAEMYSSLNQTKVIKEAALRSGVSQGVMKACWDAAGEVIKAWATEGHSVALPGLGTMRFGLRSKAVENVNEVKRVTSDDDAEVEDPENESTVDGENGSTENGGSQNQGGNSNTGGDNGGNTGGGLGQN